MINAVTVVQRQLEAYNAHDLEKFLVNFSDTIEAFRPPARKPVLSGKRRFGEFYATERFNRPGLQAKVVNRMAFEDLVVDHEYISGLGDAMVELVVVYSVAEGLIQRMWAYAPR